MYDNELAPEPETIRDALLQNLTDSTAAEVAKHIVQVMDREADEDTLEYDFHLQLREGQGQMLVTEQFREKNTWFKFDVKKNTVLDDVKKAIFAEDCNVTELAFIDEYYAKIRAAVLKNHATDIEEILDRVMHKGRKTGLKLEAVTGFELIDFGNVSDEENYNLIIEKHVPQGEVAQYSGVGTSAELFRIHFETGKGFNEIIRERKEAGDPNYKYITGAITKKMLWESQIEFFVNYFPEGGAAGIKEEKQMRVGDAPDSGLDE